MEGLCAGLAGSFLGISPRGGAKQTFAYLWGGGGGKSALHIDP